MLIAAAPYLSPGTPDQLTKAGLSYLDTTGNVSLRSSRPAIYLRTVGRTKDPWPSDETLRSLRGKGAARAVRALLDFRPPYGVRELAGRAEVPLASLARALDLPGRENLVARAPRGPVTSVDWRLHHTDRQARQVEEGIRSHRRVRSAAIRTHCGPGRDPAEGDELLAWMEEHEDAWRS